MIPGLLGSLSGGFNPLDFAGCLLWADRSQITGVSIGDPVSSWTDLSGNSNHATQAAADQRPSWQSNYVSFDGIDDCLVTPSIELQYFTLFVVGLYNGTDSQLLIEQGPNVNSNNGFQLYGTTLRTFVLRTPDAATFFDASADWFGASYQVAALSSKNGAQELHKNGVLIGSAAQAYTGSVTDVINIASRNQTSLFGNVRLKEIILYPALTALQRQTLEKYLSQKHSITIDQSPVNTVVPALSAAGWTVGQVASCDTGTWTNEPTSYAYQWQRKDGGYTDIPGATSSSYLLAAADAGKNVRCGVTPSNAFATGSVGYSLDSDLIL